MSARQLIVSYLLGTIGAIAGGALGYYTFLWIYRRGFYGMMIPGALLGLGCGALSRHRDPIRGMICAVAALGLGLFTEWSITIPLKADPSFGYFVTQITHLESITLLMITFGAVFAYWMGKDPGPRLFPLSGREPRERPPGDLR